MGEQPAGGDLEDLELSEVIDDREGYKDGFTHHRNTPGAGYIGFGDEEAEGLVPREAAMDSRDAFGAAPRPSEIPPAPPHDSPPEQR